MPRRRASSLDRVDLAPLRRALAGGMLPIMGDDPRNAGARKVFSVAPARAGGKDIGYVYVVLQGQAHDELAMAVSRSTVLRTTLWSIALVALLGLVAGLAAFALITRPLRGLTRAVRAFDGGDSGALAALRMAAGIATRTVARMAPRTPLAAATRSSRCGAASRRWAAASRSNGAS